MAWIYLILAGCFEIGWPIGLKIAQKVSCGLQGIIIAVFCIIASGGLLFLAQKEIPIGVAYAIWTGIGAAGTFVVGVYFFNDPVSILHYLGITMVIGGIIVLKLATI